VKELAEGCDWRGFRRYYGNRHAKSGLLAFKLWAPSMDQEQRFAHMWKTGNKDRDRQLDLRPSSQVYRCAPGGSQNMKEENAGSRFQADLEPALRADKVEAWRRLSGLVCGRICVGLFVLLFCLRVALWGQTDCEAGNGLLDFTPPKTMTAQEVIQKFGAAEAVTKQARLHYTYKQDVLMQTLTGKSVTGEFHEVTSVSYDEKGRRQENVTFAAQPSLRGLQLTEDDMQDIRNFMPLVLASEDLPQYNLTYAGQQHVDDLDTYVFHVEPKKEEKGKRYFEGRIWVDAQDFQIVKVCGKSGPEKVRVKKHERPELHPEFVTYRQQVDERYWFPAYTRSDDILRFPAGPVHMREIIKYTDYKRAGVP
jgi:hypothetical protein